MMRLNSFLVSLTSKTISRDARRLYITTSEVTNKQKIASTLSYYSFPSFTTTATGDKWTWFYNYTPKDQPTENTYDSQLLFQTNSTQPTEKLNDMSYEVYRKTTLGNTLQETLDDLISSQQINDSLAHKVFKAFDKSMNEALNTRVKTRYTFKGRLNTYRFCDNVWTLLFNEISFENQQEKFKAHKVKFVACDGKSMTD